MPFYIQDFLADPGKIGRVVALMITAFSLMQFVFNPIWGRLSDRFGRRPILLIALFGTAVSHVLFALSGSLEMLFATRILTGLFSATVPTAMAYISDVTSSEERAKGMGLVGAAFGLGFILGPAFGGILSGWGGIRLPLFGAGMLSLAALAFAFFSLSETVDTKNPVRRDYDRFNLLNLLRALRHPKLGVLFLIFFTVSLAFSNLETVFALYLERVFDYSTTQAGYFFAMIGFISAFTQGVLIGKLAKRFGETRLITVATLILGLSFIMLPLTNRVVFFTMAVAFIALSLGLHNPSVTSLISKNAQREEQGSILGINQSFSSLGRVLGPFWAGFFFDRFGPGIPFITAGILVLIASLLSLKLNKKELSESTFANSVK